MRRIFFESTTVRPASRALGEVCVERPAWTLRRGDESHGAGMPWWWRIQTAASTGTRVSSSMHPTAGATVPRLSRRDASESP